MRKLILSALWCFLVLKGMPLYSQVDVLTQHNDIERTGWNNQETLLNAKNVRAGSFVKLFFCAVDDQIYAQPLVVANVNIPSVGNRNVVYVATVNNTVYAFDADTPRAAPYWRLNLSPAGTRPPENTDMNPPVCGGNYTDFSGKIGIVGTPVIDKATHTLYLVSRSVTTDGTNTFSTYLHALDITTGAEKSGSPVMVTARVNGHGDGNVNGVITFDPQKQNQRPGLLLLNGIVYIGFAAHCDWDPYHGWLLGYDAATLQQKIVYNTSSEGTAAGIWMSGSAPSADGSGNIYLSTGNGTVGSDTNPADLVNRGESVLKLAPSGNTLNVRSFFTPSNYDILETADLDFGVTEVLLIPNTNLALTGCKDGTLYLLDRNNMGGYNASFNNVLQSINLGPSASLRSSLGYYKGTIHEFIYTWSENSALKAFPVNRTAGKLDSAGVVISGLQGPNGNNGAVMAVSSNGAADSTGILWASHSSDCDANRFVCPGILRAINANDVTQELWNSTLNPSDSVGNYAKFVCPTVANGKVYLATFSNQLVVYGLTNNWADSCNSGNIALNKPAVASSEQEGGYLAPKAFDGSQTTLWSSNFTDGEYIYVDLGAKYDLCRVALYWGAAYGKDYDIQVSDDALTWTTVQRVRENSVLNNILNLHASGRYVRMQGIARATQEGYSIYEMEVYGTPAVICAAPTGLSAGNLSANGVTLSWLGPGVATGYTIQYKTVSAGDWTTVTSNNNSFTLQALSCGTDYLYRVAANCSSDHQSAYSISAAFSTPACNNSDCGLLPTRWTSRDIGNIGVAGEACYRGGVFTMRGSGTDIGGSADAFRFAYRSLSNDGQTLIRIATQDATDPANKAGIMIREALTPRSRNAFIGLTSGRGVTFQYRNTAGGNTTGSVVSGLAAPYWVKLQKSGSRYSGYLSPDGLNWTQVGSTVDLQFGANNSNTYTGLAISSHNNTVLSTATMDNYSQSASLPVQMVSFTGRNINNQYIALQWTTASEENMDHFEVERSRDQVHFITIASVKASGNSSSLQQYAAEDHEPAAGINYYRLKEVNYDGKFSYSPVIIVRFDKQTAPLLFPDPAHSFFTIVAGQDPVMDVRVCEMSGRSLLHMVNASGTSAMVISCSGLATGVYIVQIRTGTHSYLQKLIKL